ncbi:L-threonylcarbamoyladenylate synthase [Bacillus weihaiensis]|uniref:Threonylcarbamoyl-AMP synthase n=1 Tax=Bacillus weihaiensis TaxID=1547283 RepID=A0A1L3MLZ9_9BACI|nr:L-threonylcarbamoyladenylate synthase [Bacillus weihaiensis]APH03375.1 threonylcarbamoyl-AMP synthase [Bacillus weihaiensis]
MKTKIWTVENSDKLSTSYPHLSQAAALLKENEVVAFPTETVYGLGANACSDVAVKKIFEAKGRPSDNPLIVHIASVDKLEEIVSHIPNSAYKLIESFWPGPLTLVLEKQDKTLSTFVTAGLDTVAVRMPDHPVALEIISRSEVPIAAPSANRSGKPSPTQASHVYHDLNGRIAGIVDGGSTGVGVESTVVDCTSDIPTILRPGGITKEQLEAVIGQVEVDKALVDEEQAPKSPGMKYTHYAPNAPVIVVQGDDAFFQDVIKQHEQEGRKVGVLATKEGKTVLKANKIIECGSRSDLHTVARDLYDVLRAFDQEDVDLILSESFPQDGVGEAVMNRLLKAAGNQVISQKK